MIRMEQIRIEFKMMYHQKKNAFIYDFMHFECDISIVLTISGS